MPNPDLQVVSAFEPDGLMLPLADLVETRCYRPDVEKTGKYRQIAMSIAAIGLVEPPVVRPEPGETGKYFLLDGHLRVRALKAAGQTQALCLVSTDDEAFTYNRRVSRLTAAQEHRMIARALDRGVSERLLAEALGFEPKTVQRRARLLEGIDPAASRALEEAGCAFGIYDVLRKMVPARQLEAAQLMIANNNISLPFAQALLSATRPDDLRPTRTRRRAAVTREQVMKLELELASLQQQTRALTDHYGLDALHFTLARGYLAKLMASDGVSSWLAQNRPEYLDEFKAITAAA